MSFPRQNVKLAVILLFLAITCIPTNTSIAADNITKKNNTVKQTSITAVVVSNFPPHYMLDSNGKPRGFAIDTLNEIAKLTDLKVKYIVKSNWVDAASTLKAGKADIIPNMGITRKRLVDFNFTTPIELSNIAIITRKESNNINSLQDIKGRVVGVVKFNVGKKIAKEHGITFIQYNQPESALIGLLSGNVDALIYPQAVMLNVARKSGLDARIKLAEKPLKIIKRGIAVNKNKTKLLSKLNTAIIKLEKTERFKDIYIKWYGKPNPYWTTQKVIYYSGLILLFIIILAIVWHYLSLNKLNRHLTKTIDELKKSEDALRKSSILLSNVLNSTPDWIFVKDTQLKMMLCNTNLAKAVGKTPEQMIGNTDIENGWDPELVKGAPEKGIRGFENDDKKALNGEFVHNPHDPANVAGEIRIFDTHKLPLRDADNKIIGVLGIARDVTDYQLLIDQIRDKEIEHREILNSMNDAVISIDETGKILTFNKAASSMFGYEVDEVLYKNVRMLMGAPHADNHDQYIKNYIESGQTHIIGIGREVEGLRKNGEVFPIRLSVSELPPGKNNKRRFIGTCSDISEYKQQELQLRRSQKMDAVGKLTGGIAHDFNNILSIIVGYTELLTLNNNNNPEIERYAKEIKRASERGTKLTRKLLSFSKQRTPVTSVVNINNILNETQDMLKKALTARIELELITEKDLWPVQLDENDLEDSILNMSINAMHAIESRGKITIKTNNVRLEYGNALLLKLDAGDYVVLEITDTGTGISKASIERIFEPFYTTKIEKGTGLGLSQVYAFVKRSGGQIDVESEEGQGTTFKLYFPRYTETGNITPTTNEPTETDLEGNERLLLVDDEPALLQAITEILQQHKYTVFTAHSAKQALELLESKNIDMVISDIIMPEMDGYQLADIIKQKYPQVKIQLASGFSDDRHLNRESDELHKTLLHKPYQSSKLLKRIRELFD